MVDIVQAKQRLDTLINKARVHLYKPMQIAEILFRDRVHKDIDLQRLDTYRRISTRWRNEIVRKFIGRTPQLNSRYEDQLFDEEILPPPLVNELGVFNRDNSIVEAYIYYKLLKRSTHLDDLLARLENVSSGNFDLSNFINEFESDSKLRRSIDKVYEIIVYALFNSITKNLEATVSLSIKKSSFELLEDFEDFSRLVLGVDTTQPEICMPARLYRVGATNVNDAGLDMWANFGPAVQVKHITLSAEHIGDILEETVADKVVIVCKESETETIELFLKQTSLDKRTRGIITENDLLRWHKKCSDNKYKDTLGKDFLVELKREFLNEFPVNIPLKKFIHERGYHKVPLVDEWIVE